MRVRLDICATHMHIHTHTHAEQKDCKGCPRQHTKCMPEDEGGGRGVRFVPPSSLGMPAPRVLFGRAFANFTRTHAYSHARMHACIHACTHACSTAFYPHNTKRADTLKTRMANMHARTSCFRNLTPKQMKGLGTHQRNNTDEEASNPPGK
jgi:hypothetical protein